MTLVIVYLAGVLCMTLALHAWKPELHWWRPLVVSILWPITAPIFVIAESGIYD